MMKAMILSAGYGKRLNPLTLKYPKPLLKIGNETLLSNTIKFLEHSGIKEVVINVHYLGQQILDYIKKNNLEKRFIISFYENISDLNSEVSKILSQNKIVARFAGREEWGARALGNRSILCNPKYLDNINMINSLVKKRDF